MGNADFMQKQIEEKLEKGFNCIKLKIGVDWESEKKVIQKLRKISCKVIELRVDANGAFVLKKLNRFTRISRTQNSNLTRTTDKESEVEI